MGKIRRTGEKREEKRRERGGEDSIGRQRGEEIWSPIRDRDR